MMSAESHFFELISAISDSKGGSPSSQSSLAIPTLSETVPSRPPSAANSGRTKNLATDKSGIVDENGLYAVHFRYQWISSDGTAVTGYKV